jgi:hypothetical protein
VLLTRIVASSVSLHRRVSRSTLRWAGCGLFSLAAFGILLLGKVVLVILGAVWILGLEGQRCVTAVPALYTKAHTYFMAVTIVLALQITVGTLYLMKCGLQDAVEEGVDQLEQEALVRQARQAEVDSRARRE